MSEDPDGTNSERLSRLIRRRGGAKAYISRLIHDIKGLLGAPRLQHEVIQGKVDITKDSLMNLKDTNNVLLDILREPKDIEEAHAYYEAVEKRCRACPL